MHMVALSASFQETPSLLKLDENWPRYKVSELKVYKAMNLMAFHKA